jgi:VanW like protein
MFLPVEVTDHVPVNHEPSLVQMTRELPSATGGRGRQVLLWSLAALLLLIGGAVGAAALLPVPEEVPKGTYLVGVAVGGLDRAEARTEITGPVAASVEREVRLLVGDEAVRVLPADAGITLDRTATEQALFEGAPQSLLDRIRDRRSGARRDVEPVLAIRQTTAERALTAKLKPFVRPAKDASMTLPVPISRLTAKENASFTAEPVKAVVVPSQTGQSIDIKAAVATLREAVADRKTEVRITVVEHKPAVTTEQASEVDQLIGTFTTAHACCAPRVTNIHRIAEIVDGSVIAPGETFSLNAKSGRRTAENGFVSAPAIAEGELVD